MSQGRIINIADVARADNGDGKDFVARIGRVGAGLGSAGIGYTLTVVPPGKRAFPFHRHHVIDELFYIIEGEGTCRIADAAFPVRAGAEAHQIVNSSNSDLRYLALSTLGSVDIVEVRWPPLPAFATLTSRRPPTKRWGACSQPVILRASRGKTDSASRRRRSPSANTSHRRFHGSSGTSL